MTRLLLTLFGVLIHSVYVTESDVVKVQFYTGSNCQGGSHNLDLDYVCANVPSFGSEITGVLIQQGSCVALQKQSACNGDPYIVAYPDLKFCNLPTGWNNNILSVRDCDSKQGSIICPEGSFIRQIDHGSATEGITAHCYEPNNHTHSVHSGNTHDKPVSNPTIKACPIAAHGLSIQYDRIAEMFHTPSMPCTRTRSVPTENKNVTGNHYRFNKPKRAGDQGEENATSIFQNGNHNVKLQELCNEGHALSGITVLFDEGDIIKDLEFHCSKAPEPASMCDPQEELQLILDCDNTNSSSEITCSLSQTVGVGESKSMSELERQEMMFSWDLGFSIEGGIPALSGKMTGALSESELVEYTWSQDETTIWTKETTVSTSIKVPPNVRTKVEQLVGKCSFYGTSTNCFKATDLNSVSGKTTFRYL